METCKTCKFFKKNRGNKGNCSFLSSRISDTSESVGNKPNKVISDQKFKSIEIHSQSEICLDSLPNYKIKKSDLYSHTFIWVDINFGCIKHQTNQYSNKEFLKKVVLEYFPDAFEFIFSNQYREIRFTSLLSLEKNQDVPNKEIIREDGVELNFTNQWTKTNKNRKNMSYDYSEKTLQKFLNQ